MKIASQRNLTSRALLILAAIFALPSCGYHFGAAGTNLPAEAHTIYVARFSNNTRITGINDEFMRYLKDEIASHKRLTLVDNPSDADLQLSGALVGSVNVPNAFNSVLEPTQYGETLIVRASLRDNRTDKTLWDTKGMSDTERFPVVSQSVVGTTPNFLQQNLRSNDIARMTDMQVAQTQERSSRDLMMTNLAHHMYDSMATGF